MVRFVITAILSIKSIPNRAMKGKTIKLPGFSLNDFQKDVADADDDESESSIVGFPFFFFFVFLFLVTDRGAIYRNVVVVGTFSISDSPIFIIPDGIVLVLVDDDDDTGG